MKYDDIIKEVAAKLNLPITLVDRTYKAYWRVIKNHINSLPLKDDLTEEEFYQIKPNVNISSIGKLNVTYKRYKNIKSIYKLINQENKDATHKEN